ncbi:MAG: glycosyltransferase [Oscillospiraceae bacterium]|nr:glycosyltransferase [Oscillospiraceae bacterium]
MIKVCHVTSAHPKEDVRIFHKECVSLAKAGYDVTLVQHGDSYEKDGVHIVGFGAVASNRIKRMLFTAKNAYKAALAVDADLYHLHDPELLPFALKLKKKGKKVVFDSHEFYAEQILYKRYIPRFLRPVVAKLFDRKQKRIFCKIDGLVFPCLVEGQNPFEGYCPRIAIINNVPLLQELYDHYDPSIPKTPRSVCHIGGLNFNRGITSLVHAANLTDCTIYLGGKFDSADYEAHLRTLPGFSRVEYLGHLNRQQVLETLQKSQVGIATLLNVGQYNKLWNLPTKVYEYMALAIPCVLSDTPYIRQAAEKYRFGICVDPADPQQIAAAIRHLLDHPEEARQMGENGRRAVKEEFNWGIEEKKLFALYDDLLKEAITRV